MKAALGRALVSGRVDRLERADGRLRVIDYKTGSSKPKSEELGQHPQLGVYQFAVQAGAFGEGEESAGAALVQIGKAAGKSFEHKIYTNAPGAHAFNRLDTQLARKSRAEIYRFLAKYLHPPNPTK